MTHRIHDAPKKTCRGLPCGAVRCHPWRVAFKEGAPALKKGVFSPPAVCALTARPVLKMSQPALPATDERSCSGHNACEERTAIYALSAR